MNNAEIWSRYNPKGLQSMDKPKSEQGQDEEFTAMLNPMVWSKGNRDEDCNGNTFTLL